ncbi:Hypothetical predicted protein [Olea europaea subsp. europaea]|uniref:Uncharacterized protein n=1 Tax=Olea europaea subsp. europaea TaxID=158383 RepID=A0A8S0QCF9_OLEEU|nr:Hypothetical predicted protein [Olea europaea subsp. europaea]
MGRRSQQLGDLLFTVVVVNLSIFRSAVLFLYPLLIAVIVEKRSPLAVNGDSQFCIPRSKHHCVRCLVAVGGDDRWSS